MTAPFPHPTPSPLTESEARYFFARSPQDADDTRPLEWLEDEAIERICEERIPVIEEFGLTDADPFTGRPICELLTAEECTRLFYMPSYSKEGL